MWFLLLYLVPFEAPGVSEEWMTWSQFDTYQECLDVVVESFVDPIFEGGAVAMLFDYGPDGEIVGYEVVDAVCDHRGGR
jgi:hypothetical protein